MIIDTSQAMRIVACAGRECVIIHRHAMEVLSAKVTTIKFLCRDSFLENAQNSTNCFRFEIGITTMVTNCTVHGKWTEWSSWSACSQTCGTAVKSRRRTCGNPAPAHGGNISSSECFLMFVVLIWHDFHELGRTCVGPDRQELYCTNLPPCPEPKKLPIDGGWGAYGKYSFDSIGTVQYRQ